MYVCFFALGVLDEKNYSILSVPASRYRQNHSVVSLILWTFLSEKSCDHNFNLWPHEHGGSQAGMPLPSVLFVTDNRPWVWSHLRIACSLIWTLLSNSPHVIPPVLCERRPWSPLQFALWCRVSPPKSSYVRPVVYWWHACDAHNHKAISGTDKARPAHMEAGDSSL